MKRQIWTIVFISVLLLFSGPAMAAMDDIDAWSGTELGTDSWRITSSGNLTHNTGYYGFRVPYTFRSDDIAASYSAVEMGINPEAGHAASADEWVYYYPMSYAGSVLAVSIYSDDPITAGYLSVDVTINGTATGLVAGLDNNVSTQADAVSQAIGTDTFDAEDLIGVKITTDSTFAPTTSDIIVTVIVAQ